MTLEISMLQRLDVEEAVGLVRCQITCDKTCAAETCRSTCGTESCKVTCSLSCGTTSIPA
jgi:hypothetical protein